MQLPIEEVKAEGAAYKEAKTHKEKRSIFKRAKNLISPWDSITRCMLTRTFERAAGEEFAW